ncbi:MAG: glycerol-3-phosphate dehydrogenase [Deltaproteobacteria bacterium]|nr:MAG: glycerol-3-phosphate dehydrogenase [Deltaproteobacteria bacterium]
MDEQTIAVLGAGSWGTALAKQLSDQGHGVRLWARRKDQADAINEAHVNERYLAGFELGPTLSATSDLETAIVGADMVLAVVPSHGVRGMLETAAPLFSETAPICAAIKGIENSTLMMVSEIFEEALPEDRHHLLSFLGGPSFAKEVAAGVPTAVCVAGKDDAVTEKVQHIFNTDRFRAYATEDVVGVELGGALKNVIAIAAGISDGLGFGLNTRAALITRGLHEISRLAVKMGANPLTMAGLGGMGDLVLTCTGDLSRNRTVGLKLGSGMKLDEVLASMTMVAEGVKTSKSAFELAARNDVDMPIVHQVYRVLYEDKDPKAAVTDLMTRPLKRERH